MIKSNSINSILMVLIPIIYLIAYTIVGNQKGPYYWTPNQDDYAYLLDSLNLVNFKPVAIFQSPGTPVQILGAGVISIGYVIQSWMHTSTQTVQSGGYAAQVNEAVLANPEFYLSLINYAFLGITAACLFGLGFVAYWLTKKLLLSLILQTTPLMMAVSLLKNDPNRVAPESLIFSISQLLVILLVIYLYRDRSERSLWFSISLGLVFGIGIATKLFFLPTIIFFLLISGVWQKLAGVLAAVFGFIAGIFPAINKSEQFASELVNVLLPNSSTADTAPSAGAIGLLENLGLLVANNVVFFVMALTLTAVTIVMTILVNYGQGNFSVNLDTPLHKKLLKVSWLVAIAIWLQVLLTTQDHAQSQFLVPTIGLAGLMMFLIIQLCLVGLTDMAQHVLDAASLNEFVIMIGLALCIAIGIHQVYSASQFIVDRANLRYAEAQKIEGILMQNQASNQCLVTLYRRASTIQSALKFAELRTDEQFGTVLDRLYPNTIFYSEDSKIYESFSHAIAPTEILKPGQTCVLFRTNPLIGRRSRLRNSKDLQKVFVGKTEVIYQLGL